MEESKNLSKVYDPKQVEEKWYTYWEEHKFFHAEVDMESPHFSIVMPPPNVTGSLHLGHALDNTLQDILTRWRRMQGYNTLWLPGTDHAGIATQAKVEEQLAKEGTNKHQLGREKFLERAWAWKEQYGNRITQQLRKLGTSCDWDRERFTMDEGCSEAVKEVFVRLYEKGLIYQDNYIINWCPKCQTTISDIEVEHTDEQGKLYHLRYHTEDGTDYIEVATTRPETMLGDTAVAVHPDDKRYAHLIGTNLVLPIIKRIIPVIADEYVDSKFGTGAVKITPAHDPNDFEVARRHDLPEVVVMDKNAVMNENAGPYQGLDRYECRKRIVKDLENQGFLQKIEEHGHAVGHCYRCDTVIEPMVSKQWFVKMKPLAEPAIRAAKEGSVKFVPERFTKIYLDWMENIRDWCISRQLWWGHRIPVWYCQDCGEVICSKKEPESCTKCNSDKLEQDPDVLDTWFSSGLWPFSTLGWPQDTKDLKRYYPTSVLVTGRDIIFFWVARMIFSALEFMKDVPFRDVFIHGLVLDAQGRKMSKSLGNGVDPIEVIDEYGADTLRFMLITGNTPGNDLRFQLERLEAARNFANKIWNAARFVLMNLEDYQEVAEPNYNMADKWILSRFNSTANRVTRLLEKYELGEAGRELYDFIWNEFCDWYIELVKPRLYGKEDQSKRTAQKVLAEVLKNTMELLHPFMPFITEEIWQHLPHQGQTVMLANWPKVQENLINKKIEEEMALIMDIIRAIRNLRSEINVLPGKEAEVVIVANKKDYLEIINKGQSYIKSLAKVSNLELELETNDKPKQAVTAVVQGVEIFLPLKGLIDIDKEVARLEKDLGKVNQEIERLEKKLNNQGFLAKAPQDVINKEKEKLANYQANKDALLSRINAFKA
ncbi:MAG: valyl-tRNA synthetase [Clostridia bacterium]|jgi:valyl-tRNA synthetase|nr:valyl-tRNA synthetase [Clostridia bacterium]MDN5324015.1 valyl-tRNA synthetase [Clostridia bacterium]